MASFIFDNVPLGFRIENQCRFPAIRPASISVRQDRTPGELQWKEAPPPSKVASSRRHSRNEARWNALSRLVIVTPARFDPSRSASQTASQFAEDPGRISNLLGCRWQRMNPGAGFADNPIEAIEEGIHHRGTEAPRRGRSGSERIRIGSFNRLCLAQFEMRSLLNPAISGNCIFMISSLRTRKRTHKPSLNLDRVQNKFSFGRCSFP
jgi:hypothetical protein